MLSTLGGAAPLCCQNRWKASVDGVSGTVESPRGAPQVLTPPHQPSRKACGGSSHIHARKHSHATLPPWDRAMLCSCCPCAHSAPPGTSGEVSINSHWGRKQHPCESLRRCASSAGKHKHPAPTRVEGQLKGTTLWKHPKTSDTSLHQPWGLWSHGRSGHRPSHVPQVLKGCE